MDRRPGPLGRPAAALTAGGARVAQAAIPIGAVLLLRDLPSTTAAPVGWLVGATLALAVAAAAATVVLASSALSRREPITLLAAAGVAALAGPATYLALSGAPARPSLAIGAVAAGLLVFGASLVPYLAGGHVGHTRRASPPRLFLAAVIALPSEAALALAAALGPLPAAATSWLWAGAAGSVLVGSLLLGLSRERRVAVAPSPLALLAGAGVAQALARPGAVDTVVADAALALALAGIALGALRGERTEDRSAEHLPWPARALPEPALLFDPDLRLADWNAAAERTFVRLETGALPEDLFGPGLARPRRLLERRPDGTRQASVVLEASPGWAGPIGVLLVEPGEARFVNQPEPLMVLVRGLTPGRGEDEERVRLTRELRGTIEELLAARHTIDLQRAELERAVQLDPLTRLSSRASILSRLSTEVAEARRYSHPVAVLRIDLDGFGTVNRTHGRQVGDRLLGEVALRLRLRTRAADAVGRSGGDDFLMILPHTDEEGAARLAQAVRRRLAEAEVDAPAGTVRCTASIGIGLMRPGEELDTDELLARADEALDLARSGGGDRVEIDHLHSLRRFGHGHLRRRSDPDAPTETAPGA